MKYLTTDNAKTSKGESSGVLTGILYLAPANESGRNVCPHASEGCRIACLYSAGMGAFDNVKLARIAKTKSFHANPRQFIEDLAKDIEALIRKAQREGLTPAVRLNGTSDLPWENLGGDLKVNLMNRFPEVPFYDYTKNPSRARAYAEGKLPSNYSLTFSRSESNEPIALQMLQIGVNVAAVFAVKKDEALPKSWGGRDIVDGDLNDLRFLDPKNVVVGLRSKGKAKKDESGFVIYS
jgi:hypothetical protein